MVKSRTKSLLKEIKSGDIELVYIHITEQAIEWAVAGLIKEANNLLEQLWKFNIPHSRDLWLSDEGLQVMWEVSGKRPANIPFQLKEISEIEQENWSRNFYPAYNPFYTNTFFKKPMRELHGLELYIKAINCAYEQSESNSEILTALKRCIENDNLDNYIYFQAATCGALLAAIQNEDQLTEYFIKNWGKYFKDGPKLLLTYLMRNRKTAIYLCKGILRDVFDKNPHLCKAETDQIIDALTQRMTDGRTLVYGKLSWSELLHAISKFAIEKKTMDFSEEILNKGTLTKPPASTLEIVAIENRLKITLPVVYKEFLLISNGFECFSTTGVTLSSADKVDYLSNVDQQLVDSWTDTMSDIEPVVCEKFKNSIIIGGHQEEQQLLLVYVEANKWECWHFATWSPGKAVYQDFRFYMEEELQRLEDNFYVD